MGLKALSFRIFFRMLQFVVERYCGMEVRGVENLPPSGPAILVANHQSYLDIPLIGAMLYRNNLINQTCWITGKQAHKNPHLQWFYDFWHIIVVNGTVAKATAALKAGKILIIFPEGYYAWHKHKLLRVGKLGLLKKKIGSSAAILGLKTGCSIIPVGILGTEESLPPYAIFPKRVKLSLNIGKPFSFIPPEPEEVTDAMIVEKTTFVMAKIDELH